MKSFNDIISKLGLPAELAKELKEAWDAKVLENKQEMLAEASNHSSADIAILKQAAEAILTESIAEQVAAYEEKNAKLVEAQTIALKYANRAKQIYEGLKAKEESVDRVISENKLELGKQKMHQEKRFEKQVKAMQRLISETLKEEVKGLHESRKENRAILESHLAELDRMNTETFTEELTELRAERKNVLESVTKLENLVVSQLTEELSEFQADKRELKEARIKLEESHERKLKEFKDEFVKNASSTASRLINETLRSEIVGLRQGIKEARENTFGRKIFEAFVGEFSTSVFNENGTARKLMQKLEESSKNITNLQQIVKGQEIALNRSSKQLNEAVERSEREKKLTSLVSSLGGVQKRMMSTLLEGVSTQDLEKEFDRYLPEILERRIERPRPINSKSRLTESTGKRRSHKAITAEPIQESSDESNDINAILAKAGIKKS